MVAGLAEWRFWLLELLLVAIQGLWESYLHVLELVRFGTSPNSGRTVAKERGCRPAAPERIGLVLAEPQPETLSLQSVANLAVW